MVVVDGSALSKSPSPVGRAPIQEHASESAESSRPDRISSGSLHDAALLRLLRVAFTEDVVNVVAVLWDTIDLIEVTVTVLIGTSDSVFVFETMAIEVTTACAATPSAEVQYAEAAAFEAKQE